MEKLQKQFIDEWACTSTHIKSMNEKRMLETPEVFLFHLEWHSGNTLEMWKLNCTNTKDIAVDVLTEIGHVSLIVLVAF